MKAPPAHCDVAVIGGGPAASVAARRLTQAGRSVVQFLGDAEPAARPTEILAPETRFGLQGQGLFGAAALGVPCAGVLQAWDEAEPDFTDFALRHALAGRAVDRRALHAELVREAAASGVVQVATRAVFAGPCSDGSERVVWRAPGGDPGETRCGWGLLGIGRSLPPAHRPRQDGLVALAVPWARTAHAEALVLESAHDGWWYAPPMADGAGHLVLVTDRDLVPGSATARWTWLEAAFAGAPLLQGLGPQPDFRRPRGMDAHGGAAEPAIQRRTAAIGDAALSLDPLSGSGVRHAIEGAVVAADELATTGAISTIYPAWLARLRSQEEQRQRASYAGAARRFPTSPFWRRRALAQVA